MKIRGGPDEIRMGNKTMSTYTRILYQIVFSTKNRAPVLTATYRKELFKYIWGILDNKKCHIYQINGVEDHLHILTHLHPSIALSDLVKDIKLASTKLIKEKGIFDGFTGWQVGYGAFTYAVDRKDALINYIKNQEAHHRTTTFREEYIDLLTEHGIPYEEKYLL
jgi:REP element-mobilizing transposase RayT